MMRLKAPHTSYHRQGWVLCLLSAGLLLCIGCQDTVQLKMRVQTRDTGVATSTVGQPR